jgi:hypothetical protein
MTKVGKYQRLLSYAKNTPVSYSFTIFFSLSCSSQKGSETKIVGGEELYLEENGALQVGGATSGPSSDSNMHHVM